jgi:hypothetical protein
MTARPLDPESRGRPVYTVVALVIVMVAVLLAAGCSNYPKNQDLYVIKLNPDSSIAWTKIIDSGEDDEITDIIQTPDGGYLIAGGYSQCQDYDQFPTTATLTRMKSDGVILWVRNFSLNGKVLTGPDYPEQIFKVFKTSEGILFISNYGMMQQLDNDGNIHWNRSLREHRDLVLRIVSGIQTDDGGIILTGSVSPYNPGKSEYTLTNVILIKLDNTTNPSWNITYDKSEISGFYSLKQLENDNGFVGLTSRSGRDQLVMIGTNGTILGYPELPSNDHYDRMYKIQVVPNGFYAFINPKPYDKVEEIFFNNEGKMISSRPLFNITHRQSTGLPSDETLLTKDLGYLTINASRADLLTANGSVIWSREIIPADVVKNHYTAHVRNIIETDDGGFLVVYGIVKATGCR